jgi:AP-4 complex subunit epsilon-1
LDLLFRMTNAVNVEFIVDKLLSFLKTSGDDHFRSDLVNQITQCAERFAPSNPWYVQTIIQVFELAGDKVKASVAQTLTQLIAEGAAFEDDDEDLSADKDNELRQEAVEHFLVLMNKPKLPPILAQTMAWVLGEYGFLSTSASKEVIMNKLCDLLQQARESDTKACIITALSKLVAQLGTCPSRVLNMITFYSQSKSLDLQQRCLEELALLKIPDTMVEVLPVDASCEDIDIDENLSFLNGFVQTALNLGARTYEPPQEFLKLLEDEGSERKTALKITPYEMPKIPTAAVNVGIVASSSGAIGSQPGPVAAVHNALGANAGLPMPGSSATGGNMLLAGQQASQLSMATAQGNQLLNTRGVNAVWGKKPEPPPPAPVPAPVAAAPHTPPPASPSNTSGLTSAPAGMWGQQQPPSQSSPNVPPPAPVPEVPKVLTEKEKMAAALFGGMGKSSSGAGAGSKGKRTSSTTTVSQNYAPPVSAPVVAAQAPPPQPSPAPNADLFHDMNSVAPPVAPVPVSHAHNELLDLMSDHHHAPVPPPQIHHQPSPVTPANNNLNVFDNMNYHSPVPPATHNLLAGLHHPHSPAVVHTPPPQTAPAARADLISDVFGNMDLSSPSAQSNFGAPVDNVKPLVINTAEFGRRWGSTPMDAKQSVNAMHYPRFDLETLRRAMPPTYHHVESIPSTMESIFSATVTNLGAVVLLHAKLNMQRKCIDIIVKSNSMDICQKEVATVSHTLSAFRG